MSREAEAGVLFPRKGTSRSTSSFGRNCVGASLEPLCAEGAENARSCRRWRWNYEKHFVNMVKLSCASSEAAYKCAEAGLAYVHDNFEFARDGKIMTLAKGMNCTNVGYYTATVRGSCEPSFSMPYKGNDLKGNEVEAQIDVWVTSGIIEPDAGASVKSFLRSTSKERQGIFRDHYFCILGAASAMGPFECLMKLGATVIAVDIDRPAIWARLVKIARNSAGTLIFPISKAQANINGDEELFACSGSNLITHTPEIANWLTNSFQDRRLLIGAYAYMTKGKFVRVSVAVDAIIKKIIKKSSGKNPPALSYLCTVANVHCVSKEAALISMRNYETRALWKSVFGYLGKGYVRRAMCDPFTNSEGNNITFANHLSSLLGPNYALAKRIQIWRALLARRMGCIVSCNIAPSSDTMATISNRSIALAYKGFHFFGVEVFEQSTTRALMTAVLLNDLMDKRSPANPWVELSHPLELQARIACHGGAHRMGEGLGTIGLAAAMIYILTHPLALICYAFLVAIVFEAYIL